MNYGDSVLTQMVANRRVVEERLYQRGADIVATAAALTRESLDEGADPVSWACELAKRIDQGISQDQMAAGLAVAIVLLAQRKEKW